MELLRGHHTAKRRDTERKRIGRGIVTDASLPLAEQVASLPADSSLALSSEYHRRKQEVPVARVRGPAAMRAVNHKFFR